MSRKNRAAVWLKRLVIVVCIGVVMLSAAIAAVRLNITGAAEAALLAFFVCVTVLILVRQFRLKREVEAAKILATEAAMSSGTAIPSGKPAGFERIKRLPDPARPSISVDDFPDATQPNAPRKEVASALGEDDLVLFLQPIVTLPDKEPIYYQTLLKLKMANGTMLDQQHFAAVADEAGLMASIDRRNVIQSIRMLKTLMALHKQASVFCTLSAGSLKNGKTYDRIFSLLERNSAVREYLAVEVSHATYSVIGSAGRKRLEAIARLGFKLCLGGVASLDLDLDALRKSGVFYLKVPATLLTSQGEEQAMIYPETLAAHLALNNIQLIATGVNFDEQVPEIMDRDAMIAQGNLFAEPKMVRAELLDED